MPPTETDKPVEKDKDPAAKKDDGAVASAVPVRSADDIVRNSLDRASGGGGAADAPALSDAILAPPGGNFRWNANRLTLQANLAEGKVTVTNMSYTVQDAEGKKREISGPSSYNSAGQQFIIDKETMQRYRVIPPAEEGGQASLKPVGRRNQNADALTVVDQKNTDGFTKPTTPVVKTADGQPAKPADGQPAKPADGQPVKVVDGQPVKPAVEVKPVVPAVEVKPAVPAVEVKPAVPAVEVKPAVPAVEVKPAVPAVEVKPGGGLSFQPDASGRLRLVDDQGNRPPKNPEAREQWFKEHGVSPEQVRQLYQQQYTKTPDQIPPIDRQLAQPPVKIDPQNNNPYRANPPMTPDKVEDLRAQYQQNPQAFIENLRRQQLEQLGMLPGGPNDKGGKPFQLVDQVPPGSDKVPRPGQPVPGEINPVDRVKVGPFNPNEIDPRLAKLQDIKPSVLDPALQDFLRNKDNRPALIELLKELQQGKLPQELNLQNNQKLADALKNMTPETLMEMRKFLMENKDGTMPGGKPGDTKFDTSALSPKAREIIDLITASTLQKNRDGELGKTPGMLASERLLDVLRQNEKPTGLQRIPDGEQTKTNLQELGKVFRELSLQQNQEGKVLNFRDLITRSLEDGRTAGLPTNAERQFTLRPNGPEDMVVRTLLDRLHQNADQKTEFMVRTDALTNRLDSKQLEIRPDKLDGIKTDLVVKPEMLVRPEDLIRGQKELGAKIEPGTKTDIAAQLPGRQERVLDPNELQAQNKTNQPIKDQLTDAQQQKLEEELKNKPKDVKAKKDDEELPVDQAAVLAALQAKKRKEQDEKDKQEKAQEKDKKEPEKRQKYIVKNGDTLESIAMRQLRDKRLAGLIYDINQQVIPTAVIDGKKVPQLREKMVIWLPTPTESKDYRARLMQSSAGAGPQSDFASAEDELAARFGKNWSGGSGAENGAATAGGGAIEDMEDAARVAYAARRKHIESLLGPLSGKADTGKPKHVVRLGETLKSVAMKHPALEDVSLWKLLAEINGLSSKTDERGTPLAKLTRGQTIILPSTAEIEAFRQREGGGASKEKVSGALEMPTRSCPTCKRTTFASAALCPGCGTHFDDKTGATAGDGAAVKTRVSAPVGPTRAKPAPAEPSTRIITTQSEPTPGSAEFTLSAQFSASARLLTAGTITELASGYKLRLELLEDTEWIPIVIYEVFAAVCLRHELSSNGQRKTIRIDLPPQAALELAQNDLKSNWKSYETKYLGAQRATT